ncbi:MAG: TIR domain-containing protein [Lachnospiraceae bacterium]|nr:TIR domain-containing protein [Lachnospiraceae bacterium]
MIFDYDVALSFAGENRDYAEKLATKLREKGVQVFYDNWNKASIWGENLDTFLGKTYKYNSLFCVTIISKSYCEKEWTMRELKFIQQRELQGEVYWLPLLLENVNMPELPDDKGKLYVWEFSIDEIVEILCEKIKKKKYKISYDGTNKPKKMSIIGENGSLEQVEVVIAFEFKDTKKEYVVYTKNEKDLEDNVTVYVSNVDRTTGEPKLMGVEDEKEWDRVKDVLRELATDDDDVI